MKNSSDTIGNRTRDLPTCSAVPQPTAPPRAPSHNVGLPNQGKIWYHHVSMSVCERFPSVRHNGIRRRRNMAPFVLNLNIIQWRMICFTPRQFYVRYPLNGRQGGPHSRSGRNTRKINVLILATIKLRSHGRSVRSLYTVATTLIRLHVSSPITI